MLSFPPGAAKPMSMPPCTDRCGCTYQPSPKPVVAHCESEPVVVPEEPGPILAYQRVEPSTALQKPKPEAASEEPEPVLAPEEPPSAKLAGKQEHVAIPKKRAAPRPKGTSY